MKDEKQTPKIGSGLPGPGRPRGKPNRVTTTLKDAILAAGGEGGLVGYLTEQAAANPTAFMGLIGKVWPLTLAGDASEPTHLTISWVPVTDR